MEEETTRGKKSIFPLLNERSAWRAFLSNTRHPVISEIFPCVPLCQGRDARVHPKRVERLRATRAILSRKS